jgi:hypothetical protein
MNIELLPIGNVLLLVAVLALIISAITAMNEIFLYVSRLALSLDKEGAPKILNNNWSFDLVKKFFTPKECKWYVKKGTKYLDLDDKIFSSSLYSGCNFFCKDTAKNAAYEHGGVVETAGKSYFGRFAYLLVYATFADAVVVWLQHHFSSAIWFLSVAGIIGALRFITGKIWGHNKRITVLEEK